MEEKIFDGLRGFEKSSLHPNLDFPQKQGKPERIPIRGRYPNFPKTVRGCSRCAWNRYEFEDSPHNPHELEVEECQKPAPHGWVGRWIWAEVGR